MGRGSRTMHSRLLLGHLFSLFTASFSCHQRFYWSYSATDHLLIHSHIESWRHPHFFACSVPVASIRKCRFELYPIISFFSLPPLYSPIPSSVSPSTFCFRYPPVCGPSCVIRRIHPWNFALVRKSEGASPLPLLPPFSLSTQTGNWRWNGVEISRYPDVIRSPLLPFRRLLTANDECSLFILRPFFPISFLPSRKTASVNFRSNIKCGRVMDRFTIGGRMKKEGVVLLFGTWRMSDGRQSWMTVDQWLEWSLLIILSYGRVEW